MNVWSSIVLVVTIATTISSSAIAIKGPPVAEEREVKHVAKIGKTVRLTCPVSATPAPIFEWYKNDEQIDFMWPRYRAYDKRTMKIKGATEDDTAVYTCKAVNGFGSVQVRVELIVVDPRHIPGSSEDNEGLAPPVFTHETRLSQPLFQRLDVGDTFSVMCESLGSPQPEIFWFKDGQHIDEHVRFDRTGRSKLEFTVMGTADAGVYMCRASNLVGEKTITYTLEVKQSMSTSHAIVSDSGPANTTAIEGETPTLSCRVKAIMEPNIKWLKKMEQTTDYLGQPRPHKEDELQVGDERYKILDRNKEEKIGSNEYISTLTVPNAKVSDSGMYICFVTNSGFGALTYNSMNLKVIPKPNIPKDHAPSKPSEPFPILIMVICLSVIVFLLLLCIIICIIRKKAMGSENDKSHSNSTLSTPDSPDLSRPFITASSKMSQHSNNNMMYFTSSIPSHPISSTASTSSNFGWRSVPIYPADIHNPVQTRLLSTAPTDSGLDASMSQDKDATSSVVNQYEIPYAHLYRPTQQQQHHAMINPYAITSGDVQKHQHFPGSGAAYPAPYMPFHGLTFGTTDKKTTPFLSDYDSS